MIHVQDIGKMGDQLELILADYRMKVVNLGFDDERFHAAVDAIHALGYERSDAARWLASKAGKRC